MNIGKLDVVPVRDAFRHEAHNFTQWLETNIDALSERVGIELIVLEREKSVGSFNVDLFCEDSNGNYVIIENQLERTDHDHLGKLLTYLVNLEARTAIWVTPEVRPEHESGERERRIPHVLPRRGAADEDVSHVEDGEDGRRYGATG